MRPGVDRLFLDANVLFSAAYLPRSRLGKLWSLPRVELVTSGLAALEARRNLRAHRPEAVSVLAHLCRRITIMPEAMALPRLPGSISLPDKDLPILAAASAARCTHLLTGDARHFGALYGKRVAGVLVLRPGKYLRRRGPGRRRGGPRSGPLRGIIGQR